MVSRRNSAICSAIIALIVGTLFDILILESVIEGINNTIPCPDNEKYAQACLLLKNILYALPYISTFAGVYRLIRVIWGNGSR